MAIIKCSECGKEISDSAFLCPYCGKPFFFLKYKVKYYLKLFTFVILTPCIFYLSGCFLFKEETSLKDFLFVLSLLFSGVIPALILRFVILKKVPEKTMCISIVTSLFSFIIVAYCIGYHMPDDTVPWIIFIVMTILATLLTNTILIAGTGKIIFQQKAQTKEILLSHNNPVTITDKTSNTENEKETNANQPTKLSFFKSDTWRDLRVPLLWIPGISVAAHLILIAGFPFISGFQYVENYGLAEIIIISVVNAIISNITYLIAPLVIRFLILKSPMKSMRFGTLGTTFLLGIGARLILMETGLSLGKTVSIPILQEIAIYYVLTSGNAFNQ